MSRVLNIVYSLLEAGPEEPDFNPADAVDPKQEMMKVDPTADIRRVIGRFKRQDLDVHSWSRLGDVLKIKALPADTGMHEEEVEMGVYAELQRMGIPVDPMAVTVSKQDGWFIIMFPLPGMPARSHKRRLPESGPDDLDPKAELLNTEPDGVRWLLANGFAYDTQVHSYRKTFSRGWANVYLTSVDATPYEIIILLRGGGKQHYYSQTFDEMKQRLRQHRIVESEDPDAIDPKSELMSVPSPYLELRSQIKPADGMGTASLQIVLRPGMRQGEWVTRVRNADDGGESWGHYFDDYEKALADYQARCERYGIPPSPPQEIRTVYEEGPDDVNPRAALLGLPDPILIKLVAKFPDEGGPVVERSVMVDGNDLLKSWSVNKLRHYLSYAEAYKHRGFRIKFGRDSQGAQELFRRWSNTGELIALLNEPGAAAEMCFNSDELVRWIEKNRPEAAHPVEESGPDDVNPRDYLKALPERDPRITITFARTTPESTEQGDFSETGWIDEEGVSMLPDEFDEEEGISAADKAVKFLTNEGAVHPSSSDFYPGTWWSTEWSTVDHRTGEDEERNFHLKGFTEEEERQIWIAIRGPRRAGR
jgi:hypothetical protein